jgi:DNA-binding NtrC family response regulator
MDKGRGGSSKAIPGEPSDMEFHRDAQNNVLVVDDDEEIRLLLARALGGSGYCVQTAPTIAKLRELISARSYDVVILDQVLPDGKGLDIIGELRASNTDMAIVVVTGAADIPLAVEAMRKGADNFLTKPIRLSELLVFLQKSLELCTLRRTAKTQEILRKKTELNFGISTCMAKVMEVARLSAESDYPVLITGETGTGKGVLASWVHENSPRKSGAFVEVNCSSLQGDLLKSELFGHAKGAFTSAVRDHPGLLEAADGGTLFLDEIGDMDIAVQAQFLKVVEDKSYRRVGENKLRRSNFRLMCATNKDLHAQSSTGRFRSDLLYRLQVLPIHIPPLRERREDIPVLVKYVLAACNYHYRDIAPDVMAFLSAYSWPGNVRELRYMIERGVLLARGEELRLEHFIGIARNESSGARRPPEHFDPHEAEAIRNALHQCGNDVTGAAKTLGMSRATLYRRLKEMKRLTD